MLDPAPVYPSLEQQTLEFWLSKAREYLTADDPDTKLLLGRDSPEQLSARLATSKLGDPAVRKALWDGGWAAVKASNDPMIQYVLRIDPEGAAAADGMERAGRRPDHRRLGSARPRALRGLTGPASIRTRPSRCACPTGRSPAGTRRATKCRRSPTSAGSTSARPARTRSSSTRAGSRRKGKLNPNTVFDISTTNDIIGGNSGSPLINARGEVIGAVFDGNIHSLGGDYGYDPAQQPLPSPSSTAAVSEALRKVYGASNIADELERP